MAWTKSINKTLTASASNYDLRKRFYYSDEQSIPPFELRVALDVVNEDGSIESIDVAVSQTSLTGGETSTLLTLLGKLKNSGLSVLGYTSS